MQDAALAVKRYGPPVHKDVVLDTWRQYRPGLASYLTEQEFRKVARPYDDGRARERVSCPVKNERDRSLTIPARDEHKDLEVADKEKDLKRRRRDARFLQEMHNLITPALTTLEACPEPSLHLWSRSRYR